MKKENVIPYLLAKGLLSGEMIVNGQVAVEDLSRRNRNFLVTSDQGVSYLLKQGLENDGAAAIINEAEVYRWLQPYRESSLDRSLSCLCDFDLDTGVLVIEAWPVSRNLRRYHLWRGRCPVRLAAQLGQVLGELHRLPGVPHTGGVRRPEALTLHQPSPSLYNNASQAGRDLLGLMQTVPACSTWLDQAWEEWSPTSLVHGDLKSDNLLVVSDPATHRSCLKLIDWELAGAGDPCWDTGSVFSDYLTLWLLSIPMTGDASPEMLIPMARYPLDRIQPALGGFWASYVRSMDPEGEPPEALLLRSVRYGAVRLLQTAFEYAQVSTEITAHGVCLVQVGLNMLERPEAAAQHLLGIPLSEARPA